MTTPHVPHVPAFAPYLDSLRAAGRENTARSYGVFLRYYADWLRKAGLSAERVTLDDLRRYVLWLVEDYRKADGSPLATSTQITCLIAVKVAYAWLFRQGRLLTDPAKDLLLPRLRRALTIAKDRLSQQEAQALMETAAQRASTPKPGSISWALGARDLALVALALATGRRCLGLVSLRLADLDHERDELRVALEKGRMGRVLPVAAWAVEAIDRYLAGPRQRLLEGTESPWLFVSRGAAHLTARGYAYALERLLAQTVARNPDLTDLPGKRISTHSLRVTFAKLMHDHGCSIRSLNELMLHRSLETTAAYTPLSVDDLRRALLPVHPRA
jgi:integrase/recombinase XerD